MGNKNDVMDSRTIWMAVQQPGEAIAVKTEERQGTLALHRRRRQLVGFRTVQIKALHGMLLEFGEPEKKKQTSLDKAVPVVPEHLRERRSPLTTLLEAQHHRLSDLDEPSNGIKNNGLQSQSTMKPVSGCCVAPLIATAAFATMGEVPAF